MHEPAEAGLAVSDQTPTATRPRWGRWCVLFALAGLATVSLAHAAEESRFFRIGTAATTGTYFEIGGALAGAISKPWGTRDCAHGGSCGVPGLVAVAQATPGSIENVLAIGRGEMESGLVQSDVAHWAYTGEAMPAPPHCRGGAGRTAKTSGPAGLKRGEKLTALRLIAALFPEDHQIVVRRDGPIHTLGDLKGKRVSIGEPESGTIADARLVLAAAGLSECDITPRYLRLAAAAEALANNEIDAFFIVGGAPIPAVLALARLVPVRLVPIEGVTLERLTGSPPFFHNAIIPGGTYPGIAEPTQTVSVTALWVVSNTMPDDLVYAITRALWQDSTHTILERASPVGRSINIGDALGVSALPLHTGAARYYAERGLELPPKP